MKVRQKIPLLVGAATLLLLGGCTEDTTLHEPGVYKGGEDVLMQPSAQREQALRDRTLRAHTDR